MDELTEHFVMALAAPRKSGKSFLIGAMLRNGLLKRFDHVIIMCPTLEFNDDYDLVREHEKVTLMSHCKRGSVESLFKKQADCMRKVRAAKLEEEKDVKCPSTLLILDDCIDSGVIQFRGAVDKIAERGRHIHLSLIVSSQRLSAISRSVRINSDYFIIFSPYSISEMEQYLEQFVSKDKRKETREKLVKVFETPHQFVLLDNMVKDVTKKIKTSSAMPFINNKFSYL